MGHIFISFLFYNVLLFIVYRHYRKGDYYIKKSQLVIYTILLVAYGTYGGGEGDYLHYRDRMEFYRTLADVYHYDMMEIQYNYLAYLVNRNYDLWRLVIFSVQFIGMSWFLKKAKLNTYPIYLCFISYCLILSVYNRAAWGPIYYFMGIYLLMEKKNPIFLIAIGLCYFSHTQNIVLLALLPLAFIELKKWHLVFVLLLSGTIVALLHDYFTSFVSTGGIEGADYLNNKAEMYSQSTIKSFGASIGENVIFALRYLPLVIIVLSILIMFFKKRNQYATLYKPYRRVVNVTIGVVILAIVVFFANLGAGTFFYRILGMALFPVAITLPYLLNKRLISKYRFNLYILIFILGSELSYIKDLYYAYAAGDF